MLLALVVLLNGAFVPSSPPVRRSGSHVMAPIGPILTRIADHVTSDGSTVTLLRGAHTCVFRVGLVPYRCDDAIRLADAATIARDGTVYLPLATVVRALGGSITYDAPTATVAIELPEVHSLVTPVPFDPEAPQATPTQIFTPQPGPAPPRAIESGDPHPRRTAIPSTPSRVPG